MISRFFTKLSQAKIVRYGLIGLASTGIHLCVAYLYLYTVRDSIVMSNLIGFFSAFLFSYIVQSKYVFEHAVSFKKAFKYFTVQFSALLAAIYISHLALIYNSYIKTVVIVFLLPLITFITHKFWTFSEKNISKASQ